MQYTKVFHSYEYQKALRSWSWIGLEGKVAVRSSLFGDVFLRSAVGCWHLNRDQGTLRLVWPNMSEMQHELATDEGECRYLRRELVIAVASRGLELRPGEVYEFSPVQPRSGPLEHTSVSATSFVDALNVSGNLHRELTGKSSPTQRQGALHR